VSSSSGSSRRRAAQLAHKAGIDHGAAPGDPFDRLHEVLHVRHTALQDIADPLPALEELHRMLHLDVRRQDEDPDLGKLLADHLRGVKPLRLVIGRHPDVDDHELGRALTHELEQLGRVARLPDDREPGPLQQADKSLSEQDVVVRKSYADRVRLHRIETIIRDAHPTILT
jgi:hypothetical protein